MIRRLTALVFVISSLSLSAEEGKAPEIVGPDGKPVKEAIIYGLIGPKEDHGWRVEKITLEEWKNHVGRNIKALEYGMTLDGRAYDYLIIDSPGCALDAWDDRNFSERLKPIPAEIRLQKEFLSGGSVVDQNGKPMPDVEVVYRSMHTGSFADAHVPLRYVVEHFPWAKTVTAENGSYRLRGITFEGSQLLSYSMAARATIEGRPMISHGRAVPVEDLDALSKMKKRDLLEGMDGVTTLTPCEDITGEFLDSSTGKPIAGVKVIYSGDYYEYDDPSEGYEMRVVSDKDGRFKITHIGNMAHLYVRCSGYHTGHILKPRDWQEGKQVNLKISLPPIVETEIKVTDTHTGEAPIFPLSLHYSMNTPVGHGWSYYFDQTDNHVPLNKKNLKGGSGDVFIAKLPFGRLDVNCIMSGWHITKSSPYRYRGLVENTGGQIEMRLDRKPGLLYEVSVPESEKAFVRGGFDGQARVVCYMQVAGEDDAKEIWIPKQSKQYGFTATKKWDDEVACTVKLEGPESSETLMHHTYVADPDDWPIEIDFSQLREKASK